MVDPAPGSTAVAEPPAVPPVVTPPAAPPPVVTPPAVPPVTPPVTAPPVTPPAVPPVTPPVTPPAVPPTASFELKAPEGNLLTKEYVTQFQKDAIAAGLSKDEAQDLLDTQFRAVKDYDDRNKASVEQAKIQWTNESKAAADIGGDNFNKTAELSKRVVEKFDTNGEMAKLMTDSGFGNYHAVLRFLSKIGSAFSEDQLRPGNPSSGGSQKSREEILFGGTTPA